MYRGREGIKEAKERKLIPINLPQSEKYKSPTRERERGITTVYLTENRGFVLSL